MPPTKKGYQNTSGVSRQTADGVFYVNGRYLCQRLENGTCCNREIAATTHSISSHNSDFHTPGRYRQLMAKGDYKCTQDGCSHQSENFQAILAHIRSAHKFKGSSDPLKRHYGIPVGTKRKGDNDVKGNRQKKRQKALQTIKEDDGDTREDTRKKLEESRHEKGGQESEDGRDDDDGDDDDDDYLDLIDPRLRKWDKDNGGSGNGGAGSGGSGFGGQLLSSNVIAASGY
ncbi:hypothetical protein F4801DRAFT_443651 [Xylaria longipes]|nr:hypothetical protein F4801DRAFT_443651 [Xylaria longipes]RYC60258.1 hypothetical protein CHU98_g5953 [Xylaria longipes]